MTSSHAKSVALGCVITAGAISSVDYISRGEWPPLRIGLGIFVSGALLLALAEPAPKLAAAFGAAVLVGALLNEGIPAARRIQTALA